MKRSASESKLGCTEEPATGLVIHEVYGRNVGKCLGECAICLAPPVSPVTLSCGHTFCAGCLKKEAAYRTKCPTCRMPHLLEPDELREEWRKWRTNYRAWRTSAAKGSRGPPSSVCEPPAPTRGKCGKAITKGASQQLLDTEGIILLIVLPTLDLLRMAYHYVALPLHFLEMGWNKELLGILFTSFYLLRCPICAALVSIGAWTAIPILVLDAILTATMLALPQKQWIVFVSCALAQGTKQMQLYRQLSFQKYGSSEALKMRAMKLLASSEVVGYSVGTLLGGILFEMGGFKLCAAYQFVITAFMVALTMWLPTLRSKVTKTQRVSESSEKCDGANDAPFKWTLAIILLLAGEAVNVFSYTAEWSLFAIYFREEHAWSSAMIGISQSGGDILGALILLVSSVGRSGKPSRLSALVPTSIFMSLFLSSACHVCLSMPNFLVAVVGQVLMGTSYVICAEALQEAFIVLCRGSAKRYNRCALYATYAFNLGGAPAGALSLYLYESSKTSPFWLAASFDFAAACCLMVFVHTSAIEWRAKPAATLPS